MRRHLRLVKPPLFIGHVEHRTALSVLILLLPDVQMLLALPNNLALIMKDSLSLLEVL